MNENEVTSDLSKPSWYDLHPDKAKAAARAWQEANPERVRELKRDWARQHRKRKARRTSPVEIFHLPPEQYQELFDKQGGRCAICEAKSTPKRGFFPNREFLTGRVRGLLCKKCDIATSYFRTIKLVENALRFMKTE